MFYKIKKKNYRRQLVLAISLALLTISTGTTTFEQKAKAYRV